MPGVRVSGKEQALRVPQVTAGFGELHEGEVLVVSHQHRIHIRVQRAGVDAGARLRVLLLHHRHPGVPQLLHHPAAADHVHLPPQPRNVAQVRRGAVRRAEDLLLRDVREAEAAELLHVVHPRPGAVVGNEEHAFAALLEQTDHLRSSGNGRFSVPDDAVAVEQHVVFRVQQVPDLSAPERHAAPAAAACHPAGLRSYYGHKRGTASVLIKRAKSIPYVNGYERDTVERFTSAAIPAAA